jgi:apolipoprotein N-acyltransferase
VRVRGKRRSRGSRELGFLSIALSFISVIVWVLMYSPDDVSFFEPMVIEIAAVSCAILAVQRGSKLWLLAIVGSLLLWSFVLYGVIQAER